MKIDTWTAGTVVAAVLAVQATARAELVTGTVASVDAGSNRIQLNLLNSPQGEKERVTISWKDDLAGAQQLENASIGAHLTVDANKSFGSWEVEEVVSSGAAEPGAAEPGAAQPSGAQPQEPGAAEQRPGAQQQPGARPADRRY